MPGSAASASGSSSYNARGRGDSWFPAAVLMAAAKWGVSPREAEMLLNGTGAHSVVVSTSCVEGPTPSPPPPRPPAAGLRRGGKRLSHKGRHQPGEAPGGPSGRLAEALRKVVDLAMAAPSRRRRMSDDSVASTTATAAGHGNVLLLRRHEVEIEVDWGPLGVTLERSAYAGMDGNALVRISRVVPGRPAALGSVQSGDILLRVGGYSLIGLGVEEALRLTAEALAAARSADGDRPSGRRSGGPVLALVIGSVIQAPRKPVDPTQVKRPEPGRSAARLPDMLEQRPTPAGSRRKPPPKKMARLAVPAPAWR